MYVGRDFDPAGSDESDMFGFDFVNDLEGGGSAETLTSTTWTIAVLVGTDAAVATRLVGAATLVTPNGSLFQTATQQRVAGLLPNVTYVLKAVVGTTLGNTLNLWTHIVGDSVE